MTQSPDSQLAHRSLQAAVGLLHAARALNTLDVGALSRLLSPLGLAHQGSDHAALFSGVPRREGSMVMGLGVLPWPSPPRMVGDDVLVSGRAAQLDMALRLAAGHLLGMVPAQLRFTAEPSPTEKVPLMQLLASVGEDTTPVTLVLGPPALTHELLSPVARDLQPVLQVLARRQQLPAPQPANDVTYDLLPVLLGQDPAMRDERVLNDARAGVYATAGGALVDLAAVDVEGVDERVAGVLKNPEGLVLAAEPELAALLLPRLASRLRAVLVLAPSDVGTGVAVEIPARLVDAESQHTVVGLLEDAALQGKDVALEGGGVVVGETALGAPSPLLVGVARRASGESKAPVMDAASLRAAFLLRALKADGALAPRCRHSVVLYDAQRAGVGRAVAAAFLANNVSGRTVAAPSSSSAPGGGSKKIRIRG
jgi:hypothetical protein